MQEDFLVIGMSPGNSYFKQEIIDQILKKATDEYQKIGIFIPDIPAISTYVALGYPENIARGKKAIPQGNALRNKVLRSLENQSLDKNKIRIFDWQKDNIENNPLYRKKYESVLDLYTSNLDFKEDINKATEGVLFHNLFKKKDISSEDIRIATHYILSEFAFMLFLPEYVSVSKCIYTYHKDWSVFEKFISGLYDGEIKEKLGFKKFPDFSQKENFK